MKAVLLLPGWMRTLRLFQDGGLEIRAGALDDDTAGADYVIGFSLSALVILQNSNRIKGKIILVNPLFPRRSLVSWSIHWVRYIAAEGLFFRRQKLTKNPIQFLAALLSCIELLGTDFSETLEEMPKGKVVMIRGKDDRFFCDEKAVEFIKSKGVECIEVEGGHNWSEAVEKAVRQRIGD